jgi:hypothetical protein
MRISGSVTTHGSRSVPTEGIEGFDDFAREREDILNHLGLSDGQKASVVKAQQEADSTALEIAESQTTDRPLSPQDALASQKKLDVELQKIMGERTFYYYSARVRQAEERIRNRYPAAH